MTLEAYVSGLSDGFDSVGCTLGISSETRFDLWLARQIHGATSKGLFSTLTLISSSDSDGFDLFFEKLEEFLGQQSGPTIWSAELPRSTAAPSSEALDLNPLLDRLRKQPHPLVRDRSLTLLFAYLNGHIASRKIMFGDVQCRPNLDNFALWLQKRYSWLHESGQRHWVRVLKYVSQREENERQAFNLFFALREEWAKEAEHA